MVLVRNTILLRLLFSVVVLGLVWFGCFLGTTLIL